MTWVVAGTVAGVVGATSGVLALFKDGGDMTAPPPAVVVSPETGTSQPSVAVTDPPITSEGPIETNDNGPAGDAESGKDQPAPTSYQFRVTWDEFEGSSTSYRSFPVGGVPFIYAAGTSEGSAQAHRTTTCISLSIRAAIPDGSRYSTAVLQVSQGERDPVEVVIDHGQVSEQVIPLEDGLPLILTPIGSSVWWNGDLECSTPSGR